MEGGMGMEAAPWTFGQRLRARAYVPDCHYDSKGRLVHNKTGKQYFGGREPRRKAMSLSEYRALMAKIDPARRT